MPLEATIVAADGSRPVTAAEMRRVSDDPGRLDLVGAPEGFDALVMADIVKARKGLSVFVARDGARLSAFGDTLESIRGFDPESQRSTRKLDAVNLLPVSEALLDKATIARFRSGYLEAFGAAGDDPLYATVSEGGRRAGMEHWLPLFYPKLATLFDYLPDEALIALDHLARAAREERLAVVADAFDARNQAERRVHYHPLAAHRLYLTPDEWPNRLGHA